MVGAPPSQNTTSFFQTYNFSNEILLLRKSFKEMYEEGRDINKWMYEMVSVDWEETETGTLKIEEVLKSEYMIG